MCVCVSVKNRPAMRRPRFDPGLGKSHGEGNGNPLWYSCLDNLMDRGSWWATVHGVARVRHDLVINNHQYQKLQEVVKTGKEACSASVHGLQSRTQLSDWTITTTNMCVCVCVCVCVCIYTYILFHILSIMIYHRLLNIIPCAYSRALLFI